MYIKALAAQQGCKTLTFDDIVTVYSTLM